MGKPRQVKKEGLWQRLNSLAGEGKLFAPVRDKTGSVWRRVASAEEICLEEINVREPAKVFVFPRTEVMMRFDEKGLPEVPADVPEQVVFGLRPCDGSAGAFLEQFFTGGDRVDPYVKRRRERTVLVGVACNRAEPSCFCVAVGGSPQGTRGLDLLLIDLGELWVAEPVTAAGEKLVAEMPEAEAAVLEKKEEIRHQVEEQMEFKELPKGLAEKLERGFEHRVWDILAAKCVNCGICTFLCPTCHCFDVTDETVQGRTSRCRVWDSCQFTLYSQHASGHNPRFQPGSRYRNRVMDKFKYTVEQVGAISCVGCGRCIRFCPAGIDIRQTVLRVSQAIAEG